MIKILIISGSPVEGSSTDILLQRVEKSLVDHLPPEVETESVWVKINNLRFDSCQACGEAPVDGFCLLEDDLDSVYDELAESDCILIGTPIYFDTVSAQTKLFIDRCNCMRPPDWNDTDPDHDFIKLIQRKRPGAMVLVGGERGYFEGARRVIAGWFKWIEVINTGHLMYGTGDFQTKGAAGNDPDILKEADELGRKLAESVKSDDT